MSDRGLSLHLSKLYSDGMVITKRAVIRGRAEPDSTVECEFRGQTYTASTDADGRFALTVTSDGYGGPYDMRIGDKILRGVYVGRVWLCGGQSNMETPLMRVKPLAQQAIKYDRRIHMFIQAKGYAFDGVEREAEGEWVTAEGKRLGGLNAVPYFFARELLGDGDTHIGLVCAAAGGTSAEAWLPEDVIERFPYHYERLNLWKEPDAVGQTEREDMKRMEEWHRLLHERDAGLAGNWREDGCNGDDSGDDGWQTVEDITDFSGMQFNETSVRGDASQSIPKYGTVWLRKKVTLHEPLTEPIILELGRAVDAVQVYVNGYKVIDIGYQYPPCRCELPPEMLIDGENLITVRLTGNGNPLKFIKGKRYVLSHNGTETDLQHGWQYRTGCEMERLTPGTWFFEIPTAVYYTMLAPVIGYGYDGCIWYQGESNTSHPDDYEELFTAFIEMLRLKNGCGLPVVFTQLPYYDNGDGDAGLNAVRDAQKRCLKIPGTAMADCYDAGEWNDIHPQDKLTVGRRLAEQAKRFTID